MKSAEQILRDYYIGKKLMALEFGANEKRDLRKFPVGVVITGLYMVVSEYSEDAMVCLKFGDFDSVNVYASEAILVEE